MRRHPSRNDLFFHLSARCLTVSYLILALAGVFIATSCASLLNGGPASRHVKAGAADEGASVASSSSETSPTVGIRPAVSPEAAGGARASSAPSSRWRPRVMSGLDVLEAEGFDRLKGHRVGVLTNHSGINRRGEHIIDLLTAHGVEIVALFSPEHGIRGTEDAYVSSGVDEKTGLPIFSLYGQRRKPTSSMLEGIDTLVCDIQDIGARFYTYHSTMGLCMEAARECGGIKVIVLDRPNPIRGNWFDGPIQDDDLVGGFTAFRHMPVAHGMTMGELALFINRFSGRMQDQPGVGCDLEVVPMKGWRRDMFFDQTGLPWVNPSPNMRSVEEELLYTMVALTESNKVVSVGRGTDRPFEYLGAPWMDGKALGADLRRRNLPGLWVMDVEFFVPERDAFGRAVPGSYPFRGEVCQGVRLTITDREAFSPLEAGLHMLHALKNVGGERYMEGWDRMRGLLGAGWALEELRQGRPVDEIVRKWRTQPEFKAFAKARRSVLLYK